MSHISCSWPCDCVICSWPDIASKMATSSSSSQKVSTEIRPAVPLQLKQVSSRKGRKYTQCQLAAKKPRVELTLKQKSEIVNEDGISGG